MSANTNTEDEVEEGSPPITSPLQEGQKKNEYLVRTSVRTMLGNPSALYHGKVVVIRSDIRKHVIMERKKKKEEKKRKKAENRRLKQEKRRQWEEQKLKRLQEEAAQRQASLSPTSAPREVSVLTEEPIEGSLDTMRAKWEEGGPIPEAIYCNSCAALSYGSRVEYEYSVSSHLTSVFLTICCYCWLPYLLRCCMDEVYYCSNCGAFLGKTSTLSRRKIF